MFLIFKRKIGTSFGPFARKTKEYLHKRGNFLHSNVYFQPLPFTLCARTSTFTVSAVIEVL